jgi:DegT/DnrJ/EryC1/StrS aminotransferase family
VNQIEFVDLKRQYASIKEEVDGAVIDTIASGDYILGDEVARFEEEWAAYCGVRYCVGVASGTAALDLAYTAIGLGPGHEVIAPANTFIATVQPALRLGARVVLVDCDDVGQINVDALEAAVTSRTRVITGVDLFGHPCDADPIDALCRSSGGSPPSASIPARTSAPTATPELSSQTTRRSRRRYGCSATWASARSTSTFSWQATSDSIRCKQPSCA